MRLRRPSLFGDIGLAVEVVVIQGGISEYIGSAYRDAVADHLLTEGASSLSELLGSVLENDVIRLQVLQLFKYQLLFLELFKPSLLAVRLTPGCHCRVIVLIIISCKLFKVRVHSMLKIANWLW